MKGWNGDIVFIEAVHDKDDEEFILYDDDGNW